MNTVRRVQNGRGDWEFEPVKSVQGLSLINANGDVADASLGYKYAIDTLAYIKSEITEQKFYTIPFADYVPTSVGRGNWSNSIFTNLSFSNAGDFASGFVANTNTGRFANVDASRGFKSQIVLTWAKQIVYSVDEVQQALETNNWDPIYAKEQARKENFDLGLQELAFKGLAGNTDMTGLLNNANVTVDTTTITKLISAMTAAEFDALVGGLIKSYFQGTTGADVGTALTSMPTHFAIPYADWLALSTLTPNLVGGVGSTSVLPRIEYLMQAFKRQTMNPNFTVYPVAYCDPAHSASGLTEYCLYRYDPRSVCFEIPIGYNTTQANTANGWNWQNVGYARVGSVGVFRNLELRYFHF